MTDKVQKIKEWISKVQDGLMNAQGDFDNPSDEGAFHILTNLDYYIDSLQEEPVSEIDFEQELYKAFGQVKDFTLGMRIAKRFYDMGKNSQEPVSEDLEDACEQLAENARKHKAETSSPFFSQTDYKQGVIDGAKWQKEQILRNLCSDNK